MAYGLLLYKEIQTPLGDQRVEVYKEGFSGSAVEIAGLHKDGITIAKDSQSLTQPITTSVLTMQLSDCGEVDYTQFFTPNATLFKVVWKTKTGNAWETRWTGFVTPDSFSENLAYRDTVTITARDNLGRLGDYNFDLVPGQALSVRSILNAAMTKAGVAMTLTYSTTKVASSPATILAVDGIVNTTLLAGKTWRDAVELLLTGLGMTLAWNDGNAFEVRDIAQAPAATQAAFFVGKSGFRQIRPAWKNLTIEQDYGLRSNFYEGNFSKADCGGSGLSHRTFTIPSGSKWSGGLTLLNPYNGAPSPYETLFVPVGHEDTIASGITYAQWVPALERGITLSMRCSNSAWRDGGLRGGIWPQPTIQTGTSQGQPVRRDYALRYRFNLFITVGTTKYVLRESWQVYDAATIEQPYLFFSMPGTATGVDTDEEVKIYVGEIPGSGTLEFVVYPPLAYVGEDTGDAPCISYVPAAPDYGRITEIAFTVGERIGALAKLVDINADHNVQQSVSLSVGQVPAGAGNMLLYLGGLFYTDADHTPLDGFARAQNGQSYDLSELVGREYITYNNDNYDALSGTMMAGSALRFDKAVSFGGKVYRIVGASLAILSNTLSAQLLQQEADFDTTAYTVTDVESENGGGYAGGTGGIGQGASGSSERFFAAVPDAETGSTVGAKALYDLYIVQSTGSGSGSGSGSGDGEVLKDVSDILRHLSLRVVTPQDADPYTVLVSDITIASEKNVVAGGVGGGGQGGGGSLASLADVTLTSPQVGDTLVYDATNHWVNTPLNLNALSDVEVGTPANGQALLWNATLGKWVPGTVQGSGGGGTGSISVVGLTMPTGFTVTGSPLTTDGTIAVTMATGYAIPTTDYLSLFSFNKSVNTITAIKPNYSMILGTSQLPLSLSVFGGASVKSLVCSTATQTSDNSVGTAASPWYAIYGTTIYEGGQSLANKYQAKLPSGTTNGQVLTWNGSAWVAGNGGGSGEVNVINSISVNGTAQTPDANKNVNITVPTALSQLSADSTHRLVTDTEKNTWNAKQSALPNGTTNGQVLTWSSGAWVAGNAGSGGEVNIINSISVNGTNVAPDSNKNVNIVVPAAQIQSDWNQTDDTAKDYIKNKPNYTTPGAGVLTVKMNNASKGTFSANATANVTIDLGTVVTSLSGYATESWVTGKGYATETWVTNKGYITSAALSGYATETWVTNKGYLTAHQSLGLFAGQASGTSNYETSDPYIILTGGGTNKGAVRLKGAGTVTVSSDANGVVTIHGDSAAPGTIPAADASTLGGIKLGFTSASRNFGVAVDENNRAYVSVPDTSVSVPSTVPTIGTSDTTLGTVGGVTIQAKIAAYLLADNFTAANIVSTLGTTAVNRATADASGNTITSAYLRKNTDDTMAGNLAIGTSSSSKKLTIYGTTSAALTIYGSGSTYSTNIYRDSSALQVSGAVSLGGATSIGGNTSIAGTLTVGSTSSAKTATFCGGTSSSSPAVTIKGGSTSSNSVDLYISSGVLNFTKAIKVAGNISATGNVVAGVSSDRRLKKDIRSISLSEAADLLSVLNPVVFQWNEKAAELGELHGVARGFIADEYLDLLPNAGRKIWGEYDAIDYNQVIPYLVAGWQQQNLRIRILEGEIAVLKEENQRLNRRIRDVV